MQGQNILTARLLTAHQADDLAVIQAYGFDRKITESEYIAELMKLYQKLKNENCGIIH